MKILAHGFEPVVKSEIKDLLAFDLSRSRFSYNDMLDTLIPMSVFKSYAEGTSGILSHYRRCPSADTLLAYLKTANKDKLQSINDAMIWNLIRTLRSRGLLHKPVPIAIDWHDDMYYGDAAEMVNGTKPKDGTSYAYQYMTASILVGGTRFVVYVVPIKSRSLILDYVINGIAFIATRLGLKIASIALDAGFFSEEMIKYLQSTGYRHVIRVPANKKIRSMNLKSEEKVAYELGGGTKTGLVCFTVSERKYYLATNMAYKADKILEMYRNRWGIETSYRIVEQFMPQTTSKNYVIRLFYFLFAVWMCNLWVLFNTVQHEYGLIVLALKMELLFLIVVFPSCPQ